IPLTQLCAYIAGDIDQLNAETLRAALSQQLPDYAVPSAFVILPVLPKLASGKLNKQALPEPEQRLKTRIAPSTELEIQLATIWQDVLGVADIGIDDNFFALGGDSIVSLQVISRVRELGWQLTPKDLFRQQTIAGLARIAERLPLSASMGEIAQGELPLTPIQHEFFATDIPERQHWNQSVLLKLSQSLDLTALQTALSYWLNYHDSFRLRFQPTPSGWRQFYADNESCATVFSHYQLADVPAISAVADNHQRCLNLSQGPLLQVVYMSVDGEQDRLLFVAHHLLIDGVSWRIVLADLKTLYQQALSGQLLTLTSKTASFKAWSLALSSWLSVAEQQKAYWRAQCTAVFDLPSDNLAQTRYGYARDADTQTLTLSAELTETLLLSANHAYRNRIQELLLTALARVICRWAGQSALSIELEGHGREDCIGLDVSRTVGWFTSVFPVLLTPDTELATALKTIKEQLRNVPNHGLGFGVLRYLGDSDTQAEFSQLPKPEIGFNYLGRFDNDMGSDALFIPATEARGAELADDAPLLYQLEINGQVSDGCLSLNWTYDRMRYSPDTIAGLLAGYEQELSAIIHHSQTAEPVLTPSDVPLAELSQAQLDYLPFPAEHIDDIYPLTPMQQGMLFQCLYEANPATYVSLFALTIQGLDIDRFAWAWTEVCRRHAVLRTAFWAAGDGEQPLQVVYKQPTVKLEILDWCGQAQNDSKLTELRQQLLNQGLAINQAPLFRHVLVQLADQTYHWLWLSHHLLLDGWSSARLMADVLALYRGESLPAQNGDFRDFIAWLKQRDLTAAEHFWRQRLAKLETGTHLASCLSIESTHSSQGLHVLTIVGDEFTDLRDFAAAQRITLNTLVQAAWLLLLKRYTGQTTVATGVTVSGRPPELTGADTWLGLFINTLALVHTVNPAQTVQNVF
ncbi:condensation domain-containing protein, partial [Methylocucumis oryzae]|uniref:condensation domain-containing protein n=1 Tax=Methylocucumis oryzae TaxID=1632867 RepID=UPI000ADC1EBA